MLVIGGAIAMLAVAFTLPRSAALAHDETDESIEAIWDIHDDAWSDIDSIVSQAGADLAAARTEAEVGAIRDSAKSDIAATESWAQAALWWVAEDAHWLPVITDAWGAASTSLAGHAASSQTIIDDRAATRLDEIRLDVLAKLQIRLDNGQAKLDAIIADYQAALSAATTPEEAAAARDDALLAVEDRRSRTAGRLDNQLDRYPSHPEVQAAHATAMSTWMAASDDAEALVQALHDDWEAPVPPPSTTTTSTVLPPPTTSTLPTTTTTILVTTTTVVLPPTTTTTSTTTTTTTTVPPVTTTTTTSVAPTTTSTLPTTTTTVAPTTTTSTTVPITASVPPRTPPVSEVAFMPDLPEAVVLSAAAADAEAPQNPSDGMATVGLVQRVVDSQLPAGVSTVAAGPLVVLGLIIDAVRAAGALMAVPWIVLGGYVLVLLRTRKTDLVVP